MRDDRIRTTDSSEHTHARTHARTHNACTDRLTTNGDGYGCRPGDDGRRPALPSPPIVVVVFPFPHTALLFERNTTGNVRQPPPRGPIYFRFCFLPTRKKISFPQNTVQRISITSQQNYFSYIISLLIIVTTFQLKCLAHPPLPT